MAGGQLDLAQPIAPLDGVAQLPDSTIARQGGSRGYILLLASDMSSYYCKGPSLMPGHPYVGVNEWLVGRLCRLVGVPSRNVELIEWNGELYAGAQILDRLMTGPLDAAVWGRLQSAPNVAYDVVVLDIWTLNTDRHAGNWLGGVLGGNEGWFLANDHDMALLPMGRQPADLANLVGSVQQNYVANDVLCNAITDPALLTAAVEHVAHLQDGDLAYAVGQLPNQWLDDQGKQHVLAFLCARRDQLVNLVTQHHQWLPNLP